MAVSKNRGREMRAEVSTRPLGGLTLVLYANVSPGRVAAVGGPSLTCELLP